MNKGKTRLPLPPPRFPQGKQLSRGEADQSETVLGLQKCAETMSLRILSSAQRELGTCPLAKGPVLQAQDARLVPYLSFLFSKHTQLSTHHHVFAKITKKEPQNHVLQFLKIENLQKL